MERESVVSSNIESIGWENDILEVEFLNGGIYQYFGVPKDVYEDMLIAESVGKYLHYYIKGFYNYQKV